MIDQVRQELNRRKERLAQALGRRLEVPAAGDLEPLSEDKRAYLLEEANALYWNELEWENITEEERLDEGAFTELAFPGFLAFIRGLLLRESIEGAGVPAEPRPEIVNEILTFLSRRVVELRAALEGGQGDDDQTSRELAMTSSLIDLVLAPLYELTPAELERLQEAAGG